MIYFLLLTLYLFLGIDFYRTKNVSRFMLWTVVLPLISSLTILHTRFQISAYYAFVLLPLLLYLSKTLTSSKTSKTIFLTCAIIFCFISFYLCYTLLLNFEGISVINIAKDIKPLLFLALSFVFLDMLKNIQVNWNSELASKILKYNFIASIIWFLVLNNTNLISFISNDAYYQINETRYGSIGTAYVLLYFIASLSSSKKLDKLDVVYILIPLFLAGNRTIFFALGVLYVSNMVLSTKDVYGLFKKASLFVISIFVLVLGVFNLNARLKDRVLSMFDYDLIKEQLFSRRFAPFTEELVTFEWYHYIFGKGIGETLFIPWFVYRENIDNFNVTMDNIYLTMYVKYGVFSSIIYFLLLIFIFKTKTNKKFKILLSLYFLIMGLTTAFMYQTKFLFMLIVLTSFGFIKSNNKLLPKSN